MKVLIMWKSMCMYVEKESTSKSNAIVKDLKFNVIYMDRTKERDDLYWP